MSVYRTYSVGWICAITVEVVAARALLDHEHEKPVALPPNDNNTYTFGDIAGHNIVIAALPFAQYGTTSAARVAADLVRSFPSIRIGLMVGIGGGVPKKVDIRLGDVVVGVPGHGNSGVYQYDYGMAKQGQGFSVTGTLNQAPMFCLTAVTALSADHMFRGNTTAATIQAVFKKHPNLSQYLSRPDPSTDILYRSDYIHVKEKGECEGSCDQSRLINRPERPAAENPKVHFGRIASANTLMKDAILRDEMSSQEDVLCFETETAGLSNHFPCLVIRGICDYADSHKNDRWQGYAALGAAAYAKELLNQIRPSFVADDNSMARFIQTVNEKFSQVVGPVNQTNEGVRTLTHRSDEKTKSEILSWLSKVDHTLRHRDITEKRLDGTGQWLLDSVEFQSWLRKDDRTLYCTGIPGVGKTFISSLVVDHLQDWVNQRPNCRLAYVYYDYKRHDQQPIGVLANLIKQLASYRGSLPTAVEGLYDRCEKGRKYPSFTELSETFQLVVDTSSKVFIVIDALDEFEVSYDDKKRLLESVFQPQRTASKNIFITSRPGYEAGLGHFCRRDLGLEILASERDVSRYIQWRISQNETLRIDDRVCDKITTKIQENADTMFLVVVMQLDQLLSQPTIGDLKLTLRNLRKGTEGLEDRYHQQLRSIESFSEASRQLIYRILAWVIFAKRPLSYLELQHAIAIRKRTKSIDIDYIPSQAAMQSLSTGFVDFGTGNQTPRLIHLTLHDFLVRNLDKWFPRPEEYLLATCLTYLGFDCFNAGPCISDEIYKQRIQDSPLYEYVAQNWGYHTSSVSFDYLMGFEFFRHKDKLNSSVQALTQSPYHSSREFPGNVSRLHLGAYFGVIQLVEALSRSRRRSNRQDTKGRTPLWYAAREGHLSVVRILLERPWVDANLQDTGGATPLYIAVTRGHEAVAKLLLRVDVDADHSVLFITAAERGHERVAKLLLDTGKVNLDAYLWFDTALILASQNGHTGIVKQILERNPSNVDALDSRGDSAYTWAVRYNHVDIVKLLLCQPGIDFNRWIFGHNPLSQAAEDNNEDLFFVLLESGRVELNYHDPGVRSPLMSAAYHGNMRIVQALLKIEEVNINAVMEDTDLTALSIATEGGNHDIVKKLLETGRANLDIRDFHGRNAMDIAKEKGHEKILQLLVQREQTK